MESDGWLKWVMKFKFFIYSFLKYFKFTNIGIIWNKQKMIYSSKYILVLFLSLLSLSSIVSCQQLGLGDSGDELSDYNCISRSSYV